MPARNPSRQRLWLGVLATAVCAVMAYVVSRLPAPEVTLTLFGQADSTGLTVFALHNRSSHPVVSSDRCWVVSARRNGGTQREEVVLKGGDLLAAGASRLVEIPVVPPQEVWRVEIEVAKKGALGRFLPLAAPAHTIHSEWIRGGNPVVPDGVPRRPARAEQRILRTTENLR